MAARLGSHGTDGNPIASPVLGSNEVDPLDHYLFPGGIEIIGDIMAPLYSDDEWEEFFEASCAQLDGLD